MDLKKTLKQLGLDDQLPTAILVVTTIAFAAAAVYWYNSRHAGKQGPNSQAEETP